MAQAIYQIRRGTYADGADFLRLLVELATFEKLAPPDRGAQKRLIRDAFGPHPKYELYVAQPEEGGMVAYAIVLWTYSSFLAKPTLYLEDLYVSPKHRGTGLGRCFVAFLAELALERDAGRLDGNVLGWNRHARGFYRHTGAKELADWKVFRYDEKALLRLVKGGRRRRGRQKPNRSGPRLADR